METKFFRNLMYGDLFTAPNDPSPKRIYHRLDGNSAIAYTHAHPEGEVRIFSANYTVDFIRPRHMNVKPQTAEEIAESENNQS